MPKKKQLSFTDQFLKKFEKLAYTRRNQTVWVDFVTVTACSISNATDSENYDVREKLYVDTIKNYTHDEIIIFAKLLAITVMALEDDPEQDFLGTIFEQRLNLGNARNGQYFTPYYIGKFMAKLQGTDERPVVYRDGYVSVHDCYCGSGTLLIAYANKLKEQGISCSDEALFIAQDIDYVMAMMCYIQLSLLGCSGFVAVGDALVNPNPTKENRWHMPMSFRLALKQMKQEHTCAPWIVNGEFCADFNRT